MAQPFSVQPITFDSKVPEIIINAGDSIAAMAQQKKKLEQETMKMMLEQKKDQERLFGEAVKQMTTLSQTFSTVPAGVANDIVVEGINRLAQEYRKGQIGLTAQPIIAQSSLMLNGYKDYLQRGDEVISRFATELQYDKDAMTAFLKRHLQTNSGNPGDPGAVLSEEVQSHPELYYNFQTGATNAGTSLGKIDKEAPKIKLSKTIDPTGTNKRTVAFEVPVRIGETVVEVTDPTTGLPYKRTKIGGEPITIAGLNVQALPESEYEKLTQDKTVGNHIRMMAVQMMRSANAQAFKKDGKEGGHLIVGPKNSKQEVFTKIPGYVDPYNPANIFAFERVAAREYLLKSRDYDKDGFSMSSNVTVAQDRTKPTSISINTGTTTTTPIIDIWADTDYGGNKTITDKNTGKKIGVAFNGLEALTQNTILDYVNKGRTEENKIGGDEIILVPSIKDGKPVRYVRKWDDKTKTVGDLVTTLTEEIFNPKAQPTAKGKVAAIAEAQGKGNMGPARYPYTAEEWFNLPSSKRLQLMDQNIFYEGYTK